MIEISVNEKSFRFPKEVSLTTLLTEASLYQRNGIAVAINHSVVPKTEWDSHILKHKDKVIVIQATQGG